MNLEELGLCDIRRAETSGGLTLFSGTAADLDAGWQAARAAFPRTGLWPVAGWSAAEAAEDSRDWTPQEQGAARLSEAAAVDPGARMAEILAVQFATVWQCGPQQLLGEDGWFRGSVEEYETRFGAFLAATPDVAPTEIRYPRQRQTGPEDLLLVPAQAGWQVPALVPNLLFDWTGGIELHEVSAVDHAAVLRWWGRRYGAELYYAHGKGMELAVARPPRTPAEVARCAMEQFAYCGDLSQVFGDVDDVARAQAHQDHWLFWWD